MSLSDYASRPFPVLAKVLGFLRNISFFNAALFRALAFFRTQERVTAESAAPEPQIPAPALITHSSALTAGTAESNPRAEREKLIRRRWAETGIRMWNARLHGEEQQSLNIQGSVKLLPPAPGEMVRRYDRLEFRLIDGLIVCEGVAVDPPPCSRSSWA